LQTFYFFGAWSEKLRPNLERTLGENYKKDLVTSLECLFHKYEVTIFDPSCDPSGIEKLDSTKCPIMMSQPWHYQGEGNVKKSGVIEGLLWGSRFGKAD